MMKRRSFFKFLAAAPFIPLVVKAVEAKPTPQGPTMDEWSGMPPSKVNDMARAFNFTQADHDRIAKRLEGTWKMINSGGTSKSI